ncbi:MAG: hypothetical protein WCP21_19115, partial [Armatimonadota bacterium]
MSCQLQECTSSLWEVAEFSLPSGPIETHSVPTRDSASTADLLAFLVGCQTQLVMPASCHCS